LCPLAIACSSIPSTRQRRAETSSNFPEEATTTAPSSRVIKVKRMICKILCTTYWTALEARFRCKLATKQGEQQVEDSRIESSKRECSRRESSKRESSKLQRVVPALPCSAGIHGARGDPTGTGRGGESIYGCVVMRCCWCLLVCIAACAALSVAALAACTSVCSAAKLSTSASWPRSNGQLAMFDIQPR